MPSSAQTCERDASVALRVLNKLNYKIITANKSYISQALKSQLDKRAVHLVALKRKN